MAHFGRLAAEGLLPLRRSPNEDTLTEWMNDERLTPVLAEHLRVTSLPFRERKIGAIIDSSKLSPYLTLFNESGRDLHCRVGPKFEVIAPGTPRQTVRAVFPHTAFRPSSSGSAL